VNKKDRERDRATQEEEDLFTLYFPLCLCRHCHHLQGNVVRGLDASSQLTHFHCRQLVRTLLRYAKFVSGKNNKQHDHHYRYKINAFFLKCGEEVALGSLGLEFRSSNVESNPASCNGGGMYISDSTGEVQGVVCRAICHKQFFAGLDVARSAQEHCRVCERVCEGHVKAAACTHGATLTYTCGRTLNTLKTRTDTSRVTSRTPHK